jgi:hypothetical protein
MADSRGRVFGSIPGIANRARISVDAARIAMTTFLSPDPDSRTPVAEGRRIETIDGGWRLINHEKYREIRDQESIREAKRRYINKRREEERKAKGVDQGVDNVDHSRSEVDRCRHNAEAEAEADTEKKEPKTKTYSRFAAREYLFAKGVDHQTITDYLAIRKDKKLTPTRKAMEEIESEATKAGLTFEQAIDTCCKQAWGGFKASWMSNVRNGAEPDYSQLRD